MGVSYPGDDLSLLPLLALLYGPALGRTIAKLADAQEGERVVIVGSDAIAPKGWITSRADTADPDADEIADPLPIVEFRSWHGHEAFRRQHSEGWDVLIGFPPQGHGGADALKEFLHAAHATATSPDARAVLLLVAGSVAQQRSRTRELLLETGQVQSLVFVGRTSPADRPGLPTPAPVVAIHWRPAHAVDPRPVRVVGVPQPGEEETTFQAILSANAPWTLLALDPDRAAKVQRWARQGNAQRLSELADVLRPDTDLDEAAATLQPAQITAEGIDLTVETRAPHRQRDGRLVALRPGDIVGRTIGDPHWTLVTEDVATAELAATRQVTVIRPTDVNSRYLLAFLRSDAAERQLEVASAGTTIPRISVPALRELLVPVLGVADEVLRDDDPIRTFRVLSGELADSLEGRYRAAFDKPNTAMVTASLADAAGEASMAADLLQRVTDPLHRARQFLPHPLARTLRVYENHRRADSPVDVYQDLLRFGETAIILLGTVGLAYATREHGPGLDEDWYRRLRGSGVPLGTWLRVANTGAEAARRAHEPLGGLASALSTNSPLNQALKTFLDARNNQAHGAGARSPYEYEQAILTLDETLYASLYELAPLARSDWFIVERLDWSARGASFAVTGRSLNGDHPDFRSWVGRRSEPLESGRIHVRLGRVDLPLGGFCLLRACSRCLHEELYYPDRLRGSIVRLRSLDRGHQRDMSLAEAGLPSARNPTDP